MAKALPQRYQEVAKSIIPYTPNTESTGQMVLITVSPALPCFLCNNPAKSALVAPAPDRFPGAGTAWLTFPICADCEERRLSKLLKLLKKRDNGQI